MIQTRTALSGALFAVFAASTFVPLAFAVPYETGSNSGMTLEQDLILARERVKEVQDHPGEGSGTPYLNPNGVIGATIISGAIFGGIFVAFVTRARQIDKKRMLQKELQ